ncbi:MAG: dinitrogenase iron-molybdenum cofactor [Firmicutes bacterium]|nr:dinitrogenase iron-molybdenum cofactor [Bacillota bacterium]
MKIAVATIDGQVAAHFGHCREFVLYDTEGSHITAKNIVPSPAHQPGALPRFLGQQGVDCVIAGGMGPSAQNLLAQQNISTIIGATGPADEVIKAYLAGNLQLGDSACHH